MLNARTLAQAPTGETSGPESSGAADEAHEAPPAADPLRPVEAFRTKGGVIVLSNRPAGEAPPSGKQADEAAVEAAPPAREARSVVPAVGQAPAAAPAPVAAKVPAKQATSEAAETAAAVVRAEPVGAGSFDIGPWIAIAVAIVVAIGAVAWLLARQKQRRNTERHAALLAGSEPIAPAPEHVGPFARRGSAWTPAPGAPSSATRTPFPTSSPTATPYPRSSNDDRSSPHSAPPPSGISAPPASERQWLSQRPPRSYKQPPS